MKKLLINEPPLQVLPSLAVAIGLNEAIIVQQLHYWLLSSKHTINGCKWIYNTYEQWQKQFPFFSIRTVRRTLENLHNRGIVLTGAFNPVRSDRTKWYTLNYQALDAIVPPSIPPVGFPPSQEYDPIPSLHVEAEQGGLSKMASPCGQNGQATGQLGQSMWPTCPDLDVVKLATSNQETTQETNVRKKKTSSSCSEPKNPAPEPSAAPLPPEPKVIITIPLIKKDGEFAVTEEYVAELRDTYPGVDVTAQLKKLRLWCLDNPTRRKTARRARHFISSWMAREQDRAGSKGPNGKSRNNADDFRGYV